MPSFSPTPEQLEIIEFAQNSSGNLAVIARAGAAKTSTLVLIAEALPKKNILCLAFNKSIAEEMKERLPRNCESRTLHGLGYRAWADFLSTRLNLAKGKTYHLLKTRVDQLDSEDRLAMTELFSETLNYIGSAKSAGYLPSGAKKPGRSLLDAESFYSALPTETTGLQQTLIDEILIESWEQALLGSIDFDDMVYCPALCPVAWPIHQLYLVDEAQDLSPLNHHVLQKMVRTRRLIAVGDPFQAIYGFRGADTKSLATMRELFSMSFLPLTITFRCAKNIVKEAQTRAPDLRCPPTAPEGTISHPLTWSLEEIGDTDAVICRNNAPLFRLAVNLIQHGRFPELMGRDLAGPLKTIMGKLGKKHTPTSDAGAALDRWVNNELKRARKGAAGTIHDKASCIRVMLEQTDNLGDAIAYLDHLLNRPGRIKLMTGHKSKGLEFDSVWFLEPKLCNPEYEQDLNLRYVIQTRAKTSLTYVNFANMKENEE